MVRSNYKNVNIGAGGWSMKRFFALLLALLCLMLTGCAAQQEQQDDPEVGGDWRTWGLVNADGVMTNDGETHEVLACVYDCETVLYLNDDAQSVYASAEYPEKIEGAHDAFISAGFDDLNGDGESDLQLTLDTGSGEMTLRFLWDASTGTLVYQAE